MFNVQLAQFLPVQLIHRYYPDQNEWTTTHYELVIWNGNGHSSTFEVAGAHYSSSLPSIMLIPPNCTVLYAGSLNSVRIFALRASFLDAYFSAHPSDNAFHMPLISSAAKYADIIWDAPAPGDNFAEETRMSQLLYTLLTELFMNWVENTNKPDSNESDLKYHSGRMIVYATRYIKKHISNPDLSLEEIAQVIGYHPNYFSQVFKRIMDISPFKFVTRVRLDLALHLLRTTDDSMLSICRKTGIKKPASLSAIIKKHVGVPPLQYRRNYKLQQIFQST